MKHVVRTSILSTKWRYVWTSIPFLNFDDRLFLSQTTTTNKVEQGFLNFVDNVFILSNISSCIQKFRMLCKRQSNVYVYKWILAALRRNVQEISLVIKPKYEECLQLPTCLFNSKGLMKLELKLLSHIRVQMRLNLPDSMSLPALKTLKLSSVRLEGNDVLNKMFSSCPVLESLTLVRCEFDQTVIDISTLKLKHLVLENRNPGSRFSIWWGLSIKIYAPNLTLFHCKDVIWTDYSIESLSALVKANIDMNFDDTDEIDGDGLPMLDDEQRKEIAPRTVEFLRALHNVEALTLSIWSVEVISVARALFKSEPIQLHNLRCLKLLTSLSRNSIDGITYLLNISPSIESLFLEMKDFYDWMPKYPYWDEVRPNSAKIDNYNEGVMSQCVLYHLKLVEIRGVEGRLNEIMFVENLLKSCIVLEKVVLYTSERQSPHTKSRLMKFVEQLRCFPKSSSCVTILLF